MAVTRATVAQMALEGIITVSDLTDFDEKSLQRIASNLRRPGGRIADPTPGVPVGVTISTYPFVFGAKLQAHLEVACHLLRFYETIGRPLTAVNIKWDKVMKCFGMLWYNLYTYKETIAAPTPMISKDLPIISG